MNRKDAFQEIARAGRALADLCDKQKDTVAWWTEFGTEFQKLSNSADDAKPLKDTHTKAAISAMDKAKRIET